MPTPPSADLWRAYLSWEDNPMTFCIQCNHSLLNKCTRRPSTSAKSQSPHPTRSFFTFSICHPLHVSRPSHPLNLISHKNQFLREIIWKLISYVVGDAHFVLVLMGLKSVLTINFCGNNASWAWNSEDGFAGVWLTGGPASKPNKRVYSYIKKFEYAQNLH